VRWTDVWRELARSTRDALFVELGPGAVLTGLVKKIAPTCRPPPAARVPRSRRCSRGRADDAASISPAAWPRHRQHARHRERDRADARRRRRHRGRGRGRELGRAQEAAGTIGSGAQGFACDVADVASVNALVSEVEKQLGSCDILVNNAGLTRDNLLVRIKDEDWDAVVDANLRGAFATIRAASRGMMKRRWGRIINITSVVGITGNKGRPTTPPARRG
jgi:hypothetical protein